MLDFFANFAVGKLYKKDRPIHAVFGRSKQLKPKIIYEQSTKVRKLHVLDFGNAETLVLNHLFKVFLVSHVIAVLTQESVKVF